MKNRLFFGVLLFAFAVQTVLGQIPQTMNYQGILTDTGGQIVANGNYDLTFKLYDSATSGTELWSETQTIAVNDGIFNAILGSVNPLAIPFDEPYWLGITVGTGSELTPRIELTASAYSLNTRSIVDGQVVRSLNSLTEDVTLKAGENITITPDEDTLTISATGGGADDDWTVSGYSMYSDRNVGIGTTSPNGRLHIVKSEVEDYNTGLIVENNDFGGIAGSFSITKLMNPHPALVVSSNGEDGALHAYSYHLGSAISATCSGIGSAGYFLKESSYGEEPVIDAVAMDSSVVLVANQNGPSGNIAEFQSNMDSKVVIDKNGNVGIGITLPDAKLHIGGTSGVDGIKFPDGTLQTTASTGGGGGGDGHSLDAADGDPTNVVFVNNDGYVGIGTTNPQRQIHIAGSEYVSMVLEDEGASVDQKKKFINVDEGLFRFGKYSDSYTFASQLCINHTGNVGIGIDYPTAKLHIAGIAGVDGIRFPDGTLQTTAGGGGGGVITGTYLNVSHNNYDGSVGVFSTNFISNPDPTLVVNSNGEGGAIAATVTQIGTAVSAVNSYIGAGLYASAKEGSAGIFSKNGSTPAPFALPVIKATANDQSTVLVANQNGSSGNIAEFQSNGTTQVLIEKDGDVGIGTTNPQGKLDVNGAIYQRGSVLHADYVFKPGYQLESIEDHAVYMWKNEHLKAIPKARVDENGREIVEFGSHQKGIVEELEKAHIYIEQLHERIKTLENKIEELAAVKLDE